MDSSKHSTVRQQRVPVVLVVGGTPDLGHLVDEATELAGLLTTQCTVADAAVVTAEIRPLALVMNSETYGCDPATFDALAQQVGGPVLLADAADESARGLATRLAALMPEPKA